MEPREVNEAVSEKSSSSGDFDGVAEEYSA